MSVTAAAKKSHILAVAPSAEERREKAFKNACIEARNLMAQGYAVRIHQLEKDDFRVFGRKNVTTSKGPQSRSQKRSAMPNYPGAANSTALNTNPPLPVALYPGDTVVVFNAEQPGVPQASIAVALSQSSPQGVVPSVAVEGSFSGAPGAFEVDLQVADTDADAFYVSYANGIVAVNANNAFRAEFPNVRAKFARVLLKARANAVNITARISR